MKKWIFRPIALVILGLFLNLFPAGSSTLSAAELSAGQALYVPAYSHIYIGHKSRAYKLSITLSIRNIDPKASLTLTTVNYHDTDGNLSKHFLDTPVVLGPMASTRYVVPVQENAGGSGANFVVRWKADHRINPPIVESVMIGTQSQQGISFTSRGQEIKE
jgi:hypothetical protein